VLEVVAVDILAEYHGFAFPSSSDSETISNDCAKKATGMLFEQAAALAREGDITPEEVERANNRSQSDTTFASMSYLEKAQALAMAEMHGEDVNSLDSRRRAISIADLRAAAGEVIRPERACTLVYLPENTTERQ